jgi:hypothetical protein
MQDSVYIGHIAGINQYCDGKGIAIGYIDTSPKEEESISEKDVKST